MGNTLVCADQSDRRSLVEMSLARLCSLVLKRPLLARSAIGSDQIQIRISETRKKEVSPSSSIKTFVVAVTVNGSD